MTNSGDKNIIDVLMKADKVYDSVVSQLNIDHNDELYVNLIYGLLERQTKDHLVLVIWKTLDEEKSDDLKNFLNQKSVTEPDLNYEDILIEFALQYPDLMSKINESLAAFFKQFIERFNKIELAKKEEKK